MKKTIIFDLDGTLLDTSEGVKKSVCYVIDYLGLAKLDDSELNSFIGPPIYESLRNRYSLEEVTVNFATELFREVYRTKYLFQAVVYDGIPELLSYLKDKEYLLGVATNKRYDYVDPLLEKYKLLSFFDDVQGTDFENTLKKPAVIRNCMNNLGVGQSDYTCMIGDTLQDFNGAMSVGIDFLGVRYGFGFSRESKNNSDIRLVETVNDIRNMFT